MLSLQKNFNVGGGALRQALQPVTAFEHRNDAAFAQLLGKILHKPCQRGEAARGDIKTAEQIAAHGVKARADQQKLWRELTRRGNEYTFESLDDLRVAAPYRK